MEAKERRYLSLGVPVWDPEQDQVRSRASNSWSRIAMHWMQIADCPLKICICICGRICIVFVFVVVFVHMFLVLVMFTLLELSYLKLYNKKSRALFGPVWLDFFAFRIHKVTMRWHQQSQKTFGNSFKKICSSCWTTPVGLVECDSEEEGPLVHFTNFCYLPVIFIV